MDHLAKEGILRLNAVRRNIMPVRKRASENIIMKKEENVTDVNEIDVSTTAWKDNKIVNLASIPDRQNPESD